MPKLNRNIYLTFFFCLGLSACSGDDSGSAPAQQAAATEAPAAMEESSGFDINSIEKAEGVIYQDEIYANWPYN